MGIVVIKFITQYNKVEDKFENNYLYNKDMAYAEKTKSEIIFPTQEMG